MKSIHAISTILAGRRIGSSVHVEPGHSSHPAQATGLRAKGSYEGGSANTSFGGVTSKQPRVGIPTLLADALLQGGSSTERRRK
jgi:hypothetical protein